MAPPLTALNPHLGLQLMAPPMSLATHCFCKFVFLCVLLQGESEETREKENMCLGEAPGNPGGPGGQGRQCGPDGQGGPGDQVCQCTYMVIGCT